MAVRIATTPSVVSFTGNLYNLPLSPLKSVAANQCVRFPAPWQPVSGDPGIQITVTNNAATAPIAPVLLDQWVSPVDGVTYYHTFAELATVQPGTVLTETVAGLPVTAMVLALFYLAIGAADVASGFTVAVSAWEV